MNFICAAFSDVSRIPLMNQLNHVFTLNQAAIIELKNKAVLVSSAFPAIHHLKDESLWNELVSVGQTVFEEPLEWVKSRLSNHDIGIAAVDVPVISSWDEVDNMFWGIVAVMSITGNLIEPVFDPQNAVPFSVYSASEANEQAMKAAGLRHFSPKEKLGFHSDGLLKDDHIIIPNHLMIYNLQISYDNPGKFHWVPLKSWSECSTFAEKIGWGEKYKIELTPIVYPSEDGSLEVINSSSIEAPIFSRNDEGQEFVFWNGKLAERLNDSNFDYVTIAEEMSASLADSNGRISIEQKPRRAIFMANTLGFHARDIFEGPQVTGAAITRSFIRVMDSKGVTVA